MVSEGREAPGKGRGASLSGERLGGYADEEVPKTALRLKKRPKKLENERAENREKGSVSPPQYVGNVTKGTA